MASEEVSKILTNLQKLKDTKMGEGSEEESEAEKLQRELEEGIAEKEAAAIETAKNAEPKESVPEPVQPVQPVQAAPVQVPVEEPVQVSKPEPVKTEESETPTQEQIIQQQQIIAQEVEALNNDGVFRHALLGKLNSIESHLHVLAIAAVKISNLEANEDGKESN